MSDDREPTVGELRHPEGVLVSEADPPPDADEPDPDTPEPDELQPELEPGRDESPEQVEARFRKSEQAYKRFAKAVESALGPLANDLTPCPLCPPAHAGFVNVHDAGRLPAEVRDVVKLFLGEQTPADFPQSSAHKTCDVCAGLGKVRTGSRVPNNEAIMCPACKGCGYLPPPGAYANGQGAATNVPELVTVGGGDKPPDEHDAWGSPRLLDSGLDNPNYGRMPQYKDAKYP